MRHKLSDIDDDQRWATCSVCGPTKIHASRFNANTQRQYYMCGTRWNETRKANRKANPDWLGAHAKGVTVESKTAMLEAQGYACSICQGAVTLSSPTDHNHVTGKVRSVLCHSCNVGIGHLKDNAALLRKAAEYIDLHDGTYSEE